jgi:hypothetical protein
MTWHNRTFSAESRKETEYIERQQSVYVNPETVGYETKTL